VAAVTGRQASPGPRRQPSGPDASPRGAWRVSLAPRSAHADLEPIVVEPQNGDDGPVTWLDASRARVTDPATSTETRQALLGRVDVVADRRGAIRREIVVDGWRIEIELESAAHAALRERAHRGDNETAHGGPTEVRAIIPGVVVSVSVNPGDEVVTGQQMLVVEAMKMQNELRAPRDGRIERVAVGPGKTIELGELLLVLA
jgi:biotin carboxyl carrier protein